MLNFLMFLLVLGCGASLAVLAEDWFLARAQRRKIQRILDWPPTTPSSLEPWRQIGGRR